MHNDELHNLYSSPSTNNQNLVKEHEMNRACSMHGENRIVYTILVENPEGDQ
jgi:hypothetical protein